MSCQDVILSEAKNLLMNNKIIVMSADSARELLEKAEELRRNCRFGDAINFYRAAAQAPDASEDIKRKSLASVELIQEINGFVNVDLMNP
jgi:hypothetical protein